jgi:hypothetical protein
MKRVDLEVRISILDMLQSKDYETVVLGWNMFVTEYQAEIIRRIRIRQWPDLTNQYQAVEFLKNSIYRSKRKKNETNDSR